MSQTVHFYVTLRDDYGDRCRENETQQLFEDLENPWIEARGHLTPGRVYPVLEVADDGRHVTVIDDRGRMWHTLTGLFKYAG